MFGMKIIENILYTINNFSCSLLKRVYAFLRFNKITNFDKIHIFPVKHIPFSINKNMMYQYIFLIYDLVRSSLIKIYDNNT